MERIVYDFKCIELIDENGIEYRDERHNKQKISFQKCRSNWVKHINARRTESGNGGREVKLLIEEMTTCVGIRKVDAAKPFFEFPDDKIIRFEMNKHDENQIDDSGDITFDHIRDRIYEVGWTTMDLS